MNPEFWKKIESIYNSAVELEKDKRAAFLETACAGEDFLRIQVESLLEMEPDAEMFIESPAFEIAAKALVSERPKIRSGDKINNYRILRLLGEGGMGEVYLAEDSTLGRKVALKMLAPQLVADEISRKRLFREASLGSVLDHPNICTVHEIGESAGRYFISMQYVEGRMLGELIDGKPLDIEVLYSIGLQIADALRLAHSKGIIHRDIKPNNIIADKNGRVKILDFGLAKLLQPDGNPAETKLTMTGVVKGTPAYMSPEQARGQHVEFSSDVFSFGVVLYEMATGKLPFKRRSRAETMNAIINEKHETAFALNNKIPAELSEFIDKSLQKNERDRFRSIDEMVTVLRRIAVNSGSLRSGDVPDGLITPYAAPKRRFLRDGKKWLLARWIRVAAAALVLLASVSLYLLYMDSVVIETPSNSLAVMPFFNESGDEDIEYLTDGMSESLINSLSQFPGLSVKPRSSVFRYKGKNVLPQQVAGDLGVSTVLNGRVIRRGEKLTVFLSMVNAKNNNQIWGKQYERLMKEVSFLEKEMVRDIVDKLQVKTAPTDHAGTTDVYSAQPGAYELYLKGKFHLNKRSPKDLQKAIGYFQEAVAVDPKYALAYAGLADAYSLHSAFGASIPMDAIPKSRAAAQKALSIQPTLAEAHLAMGHNAQYFEYDLVKAESEFKRAIELNPNNAIAHEYYGTLLASQGNFEKAESEFKTALRLEPLSLGTNRMYGEMLFFARRYKESIEQLKNTIELDESFASSHRSLARVYQATGNYEGHVAEYSRYQELIGEPENASLIRSSFNKGGWKGFLKTITGSSQRKFILSYNLIPYYADLGDKDKAFEEMNKTYDFRYYYMAWIKADPLLDPLRDDPRFKKQLDRVRFE